MIRKAGRLIAGGIFCAAFNPSIGWSQVPAAPSMPYGFKAGGPTGGAMPPPGLAPGPAPAKVTAVVLPGVPDGYVENYRWTAHIELDTAGSSYPLVEYTGMVKNGKAEGFGRLTTGNRQVMMPAGFVGYGNPFGEPGVIHTGNFEAGLPKGYGSLYSRANGVTLAGDFIGLIDVRGPFTMHVAGKLAVAAARSSTDGTMEGAFKRFLYTTGGAGPTHVFLGEMKAGQVTGSWSPLPWVETTSVGTRSGFDDRLTFALKDGSEPTVFCTILASEPLPNPLPEQPDIFAALRSLRDPKSDPSAIRCVEQTKEGWRMAYSVNRVSMLESKTTTEGCWDQSGVAGTLTLAGETMTCNVTTVTYTKSNNIFSKIYRETKRAIDQGLDLTTKLGDGVTDVFCGILGKKRGEDCHVNVKAGTTFDLPTTSKKATETGTPPVDAIKAQTAKSIAARMAERALGNPGSLSSQWASTASGAYAACVESCVNSAYRDFSLVRLGELELVATSDLSDEVKARRIASLSTDIGDFGERILEKAPMVSSVYYLYKVSGMSSQIFEARQSIIDLPTSTDKANIAKLASMNRLSNMGIVFTKNVMAPALLDAAKEMYSAALPDIPGLPKETQLGLLHQLNIKTEEFLERNRNLKNTQSFIDAALQMEAERFEDEAGLSSKKPLM